MSFSLPPIVTLAERLLVEIEQAVRRFPRYHKYSFGSDLREQAMKVAKLVHRAWRDRERQAMWLERLVFAVDDLKLSMQLGSRIHAFASFAQFERLARIASDLGRQAGGWNKQHSPNGQNGRRVVAGQRAKILSTRAASIVEAKS